MERLDLLVPVATIEVVGMQNDEELTAVVRSRQLHIYRNGKKILILAGKAQPKIIREDKLNELIIIE